MVKRFTQAVKSGRPSPALVVSMIALIAALGGVAYALDKGSVKSKHIAKDAVKSKHIKDGKVKGKDVKVDSFAKRCPSGTTYVIGSCLETGERGPALWEDALQDCVDEDRRLPDLAALVAAAQSSAFPDLDDEWSAEVGSTTDTLNVLSSGDVINETSPPEHSYRCEVPLFR